MEMLCALHKREMDIQSDQAHQKMVCLMSQITLKELEIGRLKGDGVDTHTHTSDTHTHTSNRTDTHTHTSDMAHTHTHTSDVADTHTHRHLEKACLRANMPGTDTDMAERDRDV